LIKKTLLLYHTLKHLKLKQFLWRGLLFFPRFIKQANICPESLKLERENLFFLIKTKRTNDYDAFVFLNEEHVLSEIGWEPECVSQLWLYNLHYFDCLAQQQSRDSLPQVQNLISDWINKNPWGIGTGWDPYPISIRAINWIKYKFQGFELPNGADLSLWNQLRWLENWPEYHLLGNHLFVNAKALFYGAAFFKLTEDSKIYKRALKIINEELDEQFLEDGGHFELSPMYHALAMEDLLDLLHIAKYLPSSFPSKKIQQKLVKGMSWLQSFTYRNGEFAHFNDCANGIAPTLEALKEYCRFLNISLKLDDSPIQVKNYTDSGFFIKRDEFWHLICDVGMVGPAYLPGHAHADTLSFELAVKGIRLVVNSGTSVYGTSPERNRQRGTAAHSTIEVNRMNSSQVWSGFRVAKRATPFNIEFQEHEHFCEFGASHDGYVTQGLKVFHKRRWLCSRNYLEIVDELEGRKSHAVARFFIHPNVQVVKSHNGYLFSLNEILFCKMTLKQAHDSEVFNTTYHDGFGISVPNKCIVVEFFAPDNLITKWEIL
jgi:uncharacterized heparinase superfamily protein